MYKRACSDVVRCVLSSGETCSVTDNVNRISSQAFREKSYVCHNHETCITFISISTLYILYCAHTEVTA